MPLGANKAAIMGVAGVSTADVVLLQTNTITSGTTNTSFTSGIDSTYGEYIFRFYNLNPATDDTTFTFQVDDDAGNNGYNDFAVTSSFFRAYYDEASSGDPPPAIEYWTGNDAAQSTSYIPLAGDIGNGADESYVGELHLFNPASTTYVKHWYSRGHMYHSANYASSMFPAGYINTTTAINAINFKMGSGAFDGVIKMWGVK